MLSDGFEFVHVRTLLEAISQQEAAAPQVSQWADLENKTRIANADRTSAADLEMFKSVLETGKVALTTPILVNGGASVALLAFIANISAKSDVGSGVGIPSIAGALMWFVFGVLLAALATGSTYLTQDLHSQAQYSVSNTEVKTTRSTTIFSIPMTTIGQCVSVSFVALAYVFFIVGSLCAYRAF